MDDLIWTLLGVAAVAWVTPAPLVGLGLKQAIDILLSLEDAVLAAFARIDGVKVTVHKPHSPIAAIFYDVGVVLTRKRQSLQSWLIRAGAEGPVEGVEYRGA